ncbi:exonuclease domain-containing protein [Nocardia wallacei]|uniref:exonuclease domain-containing protein n=1 Tax=Nocardia wallacei TaxID=480035 RepID=UPI002456FB52|nr:exonuclease domain-containing protein [Nocardia wallacei]
MTSWVDMPLCALDTETTGVDETTDKIVTACVVSINGSKTVSRTWLADPGRDIPAAATEVHGITTEHARTNGRPHDEVVAEIVEALYTAWSSERAVVAFNASFDLSIIAANYPGFEVRGLVVDPFVIDRAFGHHTTWKRNLAAVCKDYGVRLDDAHSAEGDALAAARLAWKLPRVYPVLQLADANSLMESQAHWYTERQYQYIDYLRRNDRAVNDVNMSWPIRSSNRTAEAA